ncbi:hypothetical protein IV203_002293 [Nitzschia inconspicua]|uniref:Uncharacterized protein n=1 Tax=Nitzschia inconspicua TaxID=303405 RepID=A0A9K3L8A4_9STRA|nr:hypothetical protein IV203_002286 [Nitzschia inconspicua]KAG7357605.1 hypothetical protein IV203_002293 [Nitzschia inconspicua]
MVQAFFPANLAAAESYWFGDFLLNQVLFPPYIADLCPEVLVVVGVNGVAVRQPALATSATVGALIGLKGGYDLWKITKTYNGKTVEAPKIKSRLQIRVTPSTQSWALAFVAFGLMNVSALPLHCLLPAPKSSYPNENPIWRSIDAYMTGASSIFLWMAALEESLPIMLELLSKQHLEEIIQFTCRRLGQVFHVIGMGCLILFWAAPTAWQELAPFGLEDWYLFPPLLARTSVLVFLYEQKCVSKKCGGYLGHILFGMGSIIALGSVMMDRPLCHWLGTMFLDTFTASNGMFLACDLCFLGLYSVLSHTAKQCNAEIAAKKIG